jgi:hypothetical protein
MRIRSCHRRNDRRCTTAGYSLLEVVLASAICASALVPALAILRDGISLGRKIDTRHLLLVYGVSKLEEQSAVVAATWAGGSLSGDFATDGHADMRYVVTRSDTTPDGGISDRLMNISVTAYHDDNGNDALDADESSVTVTTKISKLTSYESEAGG